MNFKTFLNEVFDRPLMADKEYKGDNVYYYFNDQVDIDGKRQNVDYRIVYSWVRPKRETYGMEPSELIGEVWKRGHYEPKLEVKKPGESEWTHVRTNYGNAQEILATLNASVLDMVKNEHARTFVIEGASEELDKAYGTMIRLLSRKVPVRVEKHSGVMYVKVGK